MKNHIDSSLAIAILALVTACVGFAFWFSTSNYNYSNSSQIDDRDQSMKEKSSYDDGRPIEDGWRRVKNKIYGYTVDIPESWHDDLTVTEDYITFRLSSKSGNIWTEDDSIDDLDVTFWMQGRAQFEIVSDTLDTEFGAATQYFGEVIHYVGVSDDGRIASISVKGNEEFDDRDNKKFIDVSVDDSSDSNQVELVKKIIRSFHVEDADSLSGGTYQNQRYGFSFEYPKNYRIFDGRGVFLENGVVSILDGATSVVHGSIQEKERSKEKIDRLKNSYYKDFKEGEGYIRVEECAGADQGENCWKVRAIEYYIDLRSDSHLVLSTHGTEINEETTRLIDNVARSVSLWDGSVLDDSPKTYSSKKFGISIDFPSNWKAGIEEGGEVAGIYGRFDDGSTFVIYPEGSPDLYGRAFENKKWSDIMIDGRNALSASIEDTGGLFFGNRIKFKKTPKGWKKDHYFDYSDDVSEGDLNMILNSIKFHND